MPFKSEKQRRFLWSNRPDIAEKWSKMSNIQIVLVASLPKVKGDKVYTIINGSYIQRGQPERRFAPVTVAAKKNLRKEVEAFCRELAYVMHADYHRDIMIAGGYFKDKNSSKLI